MKVGEGIDVSHYPPAVGVVFKVEKYPVYLVELALFIFVFNAKLVALGLADSSVFAHPFIPDVAVKICHNVALFLPYPEDFINGGLPVCVS